jgi:hypothetical protein
MAESSRATRIGSPAALIPWGLVGTIALVVLAERFVARNGMDFLDSDDWGYRKSVQMAGRHAKEYDVLCFGESLVKLGVVPRALQERTGWRTYNLAVPGSQASASYALLKRALASGARPRAVVVDFAPMMLHVGPRLKLNRWALVLNLAETAQLAWWARDADFFATVALSRVFPSIQARVGLRANLMGALTGLADRRSWNNALVLRNWRKNAGALLMEATDADAAVMRKFTDAEFEDVRRKFYTEFSCEPPHREAIARFLTLAAAHDVPVYWLLPPLLPGLHEGLARVGYEGRHEAFVRSWLDRFPGLTIIDGRGILSDPDGFTDSTHLSARGAYGFSLALGDAMRRTLPRGGPAPTEARPRWVALPKCRPQSIPQGLENMKESALALYPSARIRR